MQSVVTYISYETAIKWEKFEIKYFYKIKYYCTYVYTFSIINTIYFNNFRNMYLFEELIYF